MTSEAAPRDAVSGLCGADDRRTERLLGRWWSKLSPSWDLVVGKEEVEIEEHLIMGLEREYRGEKGLGREEGRRFKEEVWG